MPLVIFMHRDDMGWHGMIAGCLLKHAVCIAIASKSIWDDTGCHWTMCPAKNMKYKIWFSKDGGIIQFDTRLSSLQKYIIFDSTCPRMTWDDTG
jgi:hypothetical protein